MSIGKKKSRILKEIRAEIAKNNDIAYTIEDCKYQGECTGTCPKCESEVAALEAELAKRQAAGKKVLLTGVAASMVVSMASCTPPTQLGGELAPDLTVLSQPAEGGSVPSGTNSPAENPEEPWETMGEESAPPEDPENGSDPETGSEPETESGTDDPAGIDWELMGDVYVPG